MQSQNRIVAPVRLTAGRRSPAERKSTASGEEVKKTAYTRHNFKARKTEETKQEVLSDDIERASRSDAIDETESDPNEFGRTNRDPTTITERTELTDPTTELTTQELKVNDTTVDFYSSIQGSESIHN